VEANEKHKEEIQKEKDLLFIFFKREKCVYADENALQVKP